MKIRIMILFVSILLGVVAFITACGNNNPSSPAGSSPTNTFTPVPTSTSSNSPTKTPTNTITNTPTNSPTNSPTTTPTNSPTATFTFVTQATSTPYPVNSVNFDDFNEGPWYGGTIPGYMYGTFFAGATGSVQEDYVNYVSPGAALELLTNFTTTSSNVAEITIYTNSPNASGWGGTLNCSAAGNFSTTGKINLVVRASSAATLANIFVADSGFADKINDSGANVALPANTWVNVIQPFSGFTLASGSAATLSTQVVVVILDFSSTATGAINFDIDDINFTP